MQPSLYAKILSWLDLYLEGRISLETFEEWFFPATLDVYRSEDSKAVDLAGSIKLRIAEFTNDHWTEDELRKKLHELRPWVREPQILTSSNSVTFERLSIPIIGYRAISVGTPLEAASE